MRDYIDIGSSPCEEECVQVDPKVDYLPAMRAECRRFLEAIRAKLGPEPPGARLAIKSNPHDFGEYLQVVCHYDDADEEAQAYAYLCESDAPRTWSDVQPLQKRRYNAIVSISCRVKLNVEGESQHLAEIRAQAQARAVVREAGLEVDELDDVVASVREAA